MQRFKILVLTNHSTHSEENSIYALLREMLKHPRCTDVDVASSGVQANRPFFESFAVNSVYASTVDHHFFFFPDGRCFMRNLRRVSLQDYDAVLLRLPHPVAPGFWQFLKESFPNILFINSPAGIELTGNKSFLLNFQELCPPMQRCTSIEDVLSLESQFPVVLKPVESFGGAGLIKVEKGRALFSDGRTMSLSDLENFFSDQPIDYLGVKFLKNVCEGDKRIVVCCGQVLGASLRLPPSGSWVCNVSMGGVSSFAEPDEDELAIIGQIDPVLTAHGVVFYGIDTLADDDGRRVLSEINTLSIGGLPRIAEFSGRPVIRQAAELLWSHMLAYFGD